MSDPAINNDDGAANPATTTSESSVFLEQEVTFQRIGVLTGGEAVDRSTAEMDSALTDLRGIFDKYLELPSLLDKYVERMVNQLANAARLLMEDADVLESKTFWASSLPRQFSALYALSKVRGRKRVQKFLPHRVEDIHVVLQTLKGVEIISQNETKATLDSTTTGQPQLWESIYILWNWMGMLSLVPFKSSVVIDLESIQDLVELGKHYLSEAGPTREMASACLASWLARPDLEESHLEHFKQWSVGILREYLENPREIMRTMGVLKTLVTIVKISTSERETLLRFVSPLHGTMMKITEQRPNNILLRKYLVKWWTRTGALFMPPRVAAWRYQRGRRSLKENLLRSTEKKPASSKPNMAELSPESDAVKCKTPEEYELFLVPDQVEDALGEVISGLTDTSTVVRWSAAKGVGRITERLPAMCSDDVLDAILELFGDMEKDNDWHGACLAMAELARRGLLLPHRLDEVIPKIVEAIHYDVPRRQTSVGAHVRDAACYTYWAIARAYSPQILKPFVSALSQSVVTAFLFDREVNCRRAASAAFQEFVGRQGATNFKNGIAILTKADFFSLGNRNDAYLSIAPEIAQYDEYRTVIVNHLYRIKLQHWDQIVRLLSSQALGKLTALHTNHVGEEVIPYLLHNSLDERNVQLRHGSVVGLAEIILAIGEMKATRSGSFEGLLSTESLSQIAELIPAIEKKRLYRGKGGEQMRAAVCRLIECISIAEVPLTVPLQVRLLDSVDACIPHPNEEVQEQATVALSQLMRVYFPVGPNGPSDRLQKRVVDKYVKEVRTSINPAATRGFSMALGRLPAKLLAPSSKVLDLSLANLCRISRPDATVGQEKDAETRRNALVALAQICKTVGIMPWEGSDTCIVCLSPKQVGHVFTALFRGLDDYNMERRGDVGSMSRIAAIHGLVSLIETITTSFPLDTIDVSFDAGICEKLVGGLLKQLSEKLDAVRCKAGQCLVRVLMQTNPEIPYLKEKGRLIEYLGIEEIPKGLGESTNWADAAATFPLVVRCLDIDVYFPFVLSGLVISVGSLTQSVSKEAGGALMKWVKDTSDQNVGRLGKAFIDLFGQHLHEGRVIQPLLKTISLLMNRLCIEQLVDDTFFSMSLLNRLKEEEADCKDVHRLTAIIDVSLGLVGTETDCQKETLAFVCKLLMHPFPRIRRFVAENLYVKLVEQPTACDNNPALDLLLSNPWDSIDVITATKLATEVATSLDVAQLLLDPPIQEKSTILPSGLTN